MASLRLEDMIYCDDDGYWVRDDSRLSHFEIFAPSPSGTHSQRIASIGKNYGLRRCIKEIERRKTAIART